MAGAENREAQNPRKRKLKRNATYPLQWRFEIAAETMYLLASQVAMCTAICDVLDADTRRNGAASALKLLSK